MIKVSMAVLRILGVYFSYNSTVNFENRAGLLD